MCPLHEKKGLLFRCCIGDLLEEKEIEFFEQENIIRDDPRFVFHKGISLKNDTEQLGHKRALKNFNAYCKKRDEPGDEFDMRFPNQAPQINRMVKLKTLAEEIRELYRKQVEKSIVADIGNSGSDDSSEITKKKSNHKKNTKRKSLQPLEELARTLTFPTDEHENDDWILAKQIGTPSVSTLRTRRSEGEKYEIQVDGILDQSILGRDKQGRIWWTPEKESQKVFYFRETLPQPVTVSSKNTRKKKKVEKNVIFSVATISLLQPLLCNDFFCFSLPLLTHYSVTGSDA